MKCFLRTNSPEIRKQITNAGITVCICASFPQSEWLTYSEANPVYHVHGVYPADDDEPEKFYFGDKSNFKEIFLEGAKDYLDCGEDVELFIKTVKNG